jgi:thiosulfate reductase cytochrome b subunit
MSPTRNEGTGIRWRSLLWVVPTVLLALALFALAARWLREQPDVAAFLARYPGQVARPNSGPDGLPAWLDWQHAFNAFFMILIVRTGWQVRTQTRPEAFWTRNNKGLLRLKRPPKKISLILWLHLSLDAMWVINGALFYLLIFSTGHWTRIVPTDWGAFPNALSAAIQYASLQWPSEDGWIAYNGLQLLSYFAVVFIASPLAILTGLRMSPLWPAEGTLTRVYPAELARRMHYPTMMFFVAFIVVHVLLVLTTGALNNLNHMYAARNDESWIGFSLFAVSTVITVLACVAARPLFLTPVASISGKVTSR